MEIVELKQRLRIGARGESQETISQSMLALEDEISELRQVTPEWKGTEANGPRETFAVRSDVTQKAAPGSPKLQGGGRSL